MRLRQARGSADSPGRIDAAARALQSAGQTAPRRPHRLGVRTPPFQGGNTGSNPVGGTKGSGLIYVRRCSRMAIKSLEGESPTLTLSTEVPADLAAKETC